MGATTQLLQSAALSIEMGQFSRFGNDANGVTWNFGKSRGAAIGTLASVADEDVLLNFSVRGVAGDHTSISEAATYQVVVPLLGIEATTIAGDHVWSTRNITGVFAERWRITSEGVFSTGATGRIHMGTGTLPTSGAIRINAADHVGEVIRSINGTCLGRIYNDTSQVLIGTASAHPTILIANNAGKWRVDSTASVSSLASQETTARIVGGATNGLAIRNSGDTRDNLRITDTGTLIGDDGTRGFRMQGSPASGELTAGYVWTGTTTSDVWLWPDFNDGTAGRKVGMGYYGNAGTSYSAIEISNLGAGFGALRLMTSGGNVVVGGTAAGATANGTLAFALNGTNPSATVDLVHLYGQDISAGNRALAVYQEAAVSAAAAVASTTGLPVIWNGTPYRLLATTVMS